MLKDNVVMFKGKRDGITVLLDEEADFGYIKDALGKKVIDARKFFGGAKTAISFTGRQLTEEEEIQLLSIISEKANLNISFVSNAASNQKEDQQTKKTVLLPQSLAVQHLGAEHMTKYHNGSLRSGQSIRFSGSVVVVGDINPGAEIIAEGNIIILGAAKGLVHAGSSGNKECFISAIRLMPIQLRIANIMTYIPKENGRKNRKKVSPVYAYVKDDQIYVAPLVND